VVVSRRLVAFVAATSIALLVVATVWADDARELIFWLAVAGGAVLLAAVLVQLVGPRN
jgi:hypothetical protein